MGKRKPKLPYTSSGSSGLSHLIKQANSMPTKIYNLGIGEPDFSIFEEITGQTIAFLGRSTSYKYTPASGTKELKEMICQDWAKKGLTTNPKRIAISHGAKTLLTACLSALHEPMAIQSAFCFSPYYPSFKSICTSLGIRFQAISNMPYFKKNTLNFARLSRAAKKTKEEKSHLKDFFSCLDDILIINSPNNPTGQVIDSFDLESLANIAIKENLWVVSDESYCDFVYDYHQHTLISRLKDMGDRTLTIRSFSKSYNMCGWRIGYVEGPEKVIERINRFLGNCIGCPSTISQAGAYYALNKVGSEQIQKNLAYLHEIRSIVADWLEEKDFFFVMPQGAFYFFVDISNWLEKHKEVKDCLDFTQECLTQAQVILAPGLDYGNYPRYIRLAYPLNKRKLIEAIGNLDNFLD